MSGNNEPLDEALLALESVCSQMLKLSGHLLRHTPVGMYKQFVYNSTVGGDCDYAQKSRLMFWKQQKDGIKRQLIEVRDELNKALDMIEDEKWDPTIES